jgi:hypothetical protein
MAVAGAGDVNGDGLDDVLVTSRDFGVFGPPEMPQGVRNGAVYVVFGKTDGEDVQSSALFASRGPGFAIVGTSDFTFVGFSAAGIGDVNGDARADIALNAVVAQGTVSGIFVVFGKDDGAAVSLSDVASGIGGFAVTEDAVDEDWVSAAGVGDVNGDGLADMAIGGVYSPRGELTVAANIGRVRVLLGRRDARSLTLTDLNADPSLGYALTGVAEGDNASAVEAAGDVNGDGVDDLLILAPTALRDASGAPAGTGDAGVTTEETPFSGMAYVLLGGRASPPPSLADIERGSAAGYAISSGVDVGLRGGATSGDIDADGFADLVFTMAPTPALESQVVFGSADLGSLQLAAPSERILRIEGNEEQRTNRVVASGADFNGDGLDDLLVGAYLYTPAPQLGGGAYLMFGYDARGTLNGRGPALLGDARPNVFELPSIPPILVRGGHGSDTLRASSKTPTVDLRARGRWESIEIVDVRGGGPHRVLLDEVALRRIPENQPGFAFSLTRTLTVLGDADDSVELEANGFGSRGGRDGRVVYAKDGVYYGLELSQEIAFEPFDPSQ